MDRIDEILSYIDVEFEKILLDKKKKIEDMFIKNRTDIESNFYKLIKILINSKSELNDDIYIIISPLNSSIITKKYQLILIACNEELYLDNNSIYNYFSINYLFEYINIDIEHIKKEINKKYTRLTEFELQEITFKYSKKYMNLYSYYIKQILNSLINQQILTPLDHKITFLYGDFMEKLDIVCELKEHI